MSKDNQRERQGKVYDLAFARASMSCLSIPSLKTGCSWWDSRRCPGAAPSLPLSLSFSSTAYPSPRRLSISTASSAQEYECRSGWVASLALPKATRAKRVSTKMKVELHTQTQYDCPHWAQENGTFVKLSPDPWDIHLVLLQVASCSLFIYSINCGISSWTDMMMTAWKCFGLLIQLYNKLNTNTTLNK